ncbi:MAG TPA: putative ABC exporter domain-containing protein [Thermoanaerobaculia bacterium]|nr:putative ABC exporter domain-containing protein [Thermoanaerobaculia bacterium]
MIGTFLTVAFLTLKNRILQRVRRLRQPRYLIGAIAGALYFWYLIFRHSAGNGRILLKTFGISPVVPDVASVVVLMLMILAWALPGDSGGIEFSEAEIAFLFPAPLRRRDVLLYKILRAQPQALFSALIMTVLGWWRRGLFVGVWVTISALSIYFIMVSLGRARLRLLRIGFIPRLLGVAAIVASLFWLAVSEVRNLPPAAFRDAPSFFKALDAPAIFQKPLIRTILFIPHFFAYAALPSSLASLALSSLAVIALAVAFFYLAAALNVSFEEASLSASQKRASRREHAGGRRRGASVMFRRAPPPFRLQETGPVEVAILWKNLIALMRNSIAWVVIFVAMLLIMLGVAL